MYPYGLGLQQPFERNSLASGEAYEWSKRRKPIKGNNKDKAYTRIAPNDLFSTFVTHLHLQCAKDRHTLHWEQPRSLTLMEVKRAFGYLDDDVLVGSPA